MIEGFKKTLTSNILFLILVMGVFWVGADLREFGAESSIGYNTVFSFYFDKSSRLLQDGRFLAIDQWGLAPAFHEENTPPLLAYITVGMYKMFNFFHPSPFEAFVDIFPILIYGLWFLSIILVFSDFYNRWAGLAMGTVLSFLPVSIELTRRGSYFEEVVGNWFLFLSIYFLIKIILGRNQRQWFWLVGGVITITGLTLSWQQFPVFYGVALLAILLSMNIKSVDFHKRLAQWVIALGLPLLLGHVIASILVGNDYSPLLVLKESAIGLWQHNDPDLLLSMQRADWANAGWRHLYRYFGLLGIVLIVMGFLNVVFDFKNFTKRTAGIFCVASLLMLAAFVKERFLALSMSLPLMALGFHTLFVPYPTLVAMRRFGRCVLSLGKMIFQNIVFHKRIYIALGSMLLLIVGITALVFTKWYSPPPEPIIRLIGLEKPPIIGKEMEIEIVLENSGGSPLRNKNAFAGLHVEIENADVHNVRSYSEDAEKQVVFKNFARTGRFFFFETKYGFLDAGKKAVVTFSITPVAEPVKIYYLGWIPGPCSKEEQKKVIEDLRPGWQNIDKAGWRNENCIRRAPAFTDITNPTCRVPVFAAHSTLQNFRCLVAPQDK